MKKLVQIGVVAGRSPSGDFLPAQPIYRETETGAGAPEIGVLDEEELFALFAEKYESFRRAKKCSKGS